MRTLYVAWQAPSPLRAWFPIGQLEAEPKKPVYVFRYTKGALRAHKETGFEPLPAFPRFRQRYESGELFPLFQNRVLGSKRKDFAEYLRWLDLDRNADPIEILARTGGERQTDNFSAVIIRFNNDSAPSARRILVELKGHLPPGKTPMNGPDFKPLPST